MSAIVKLSSKLPGDAEINGLDAINNQLMESTEPVVVIAWVVPTKITEDIATSERVPTVEVRRVEPIGYPADVPKAIHDIAADRYEKRTGRDPLPMDELIAPAGDVEDLDDDTDEDAEQPRLAGDPAQIGEIFTYGNDDDPDDAA